LQHVVGRFGVAKLVMKKAMQFALVGRPGPEYAAKSPRAKTV